MYADYQLEAYLNNGEQASYPRLSSAKNLPTTNVHNGLDKHNGGETTLATAAIEEGCDAGL